MHSKQLNAPANYYPSHIEGCQTPITNNLVHYRNLYQGPDQFIRRTVDYSKMRVYDEKYRKESERLSTLSNFPIKSSQLRESIAKTGFYFSRKTQDLNEVEFDEVKCIYCQGTIKNWKVCDNPKKRHKFQYPTCPFLLNLNVANQPVDYSGIKEPMIDQSIEVANEIIRTKIEDNYLDFINDLNSFDLYKRESSFDNDDRFRKFAINGFSKVSKNGLFYLQCCWCFKEVEFLDGIETLKEDNFHSKDCSINKESKQIEFNYPRPESKSQCLVEYSITPQEIDARMDLRRFSQISKLKKWKRDDLHRLVEKKLKREGKDYQSAYELLWDFNHLKSEEESMDKEPDTSYEFLITGYHCVVCLDNPVDVLFLPCGHLKTCERCSKSLTTCPVCRHIIDRRVRKLRLQDFPKIKD